MPMIMTSLPLSITTARSVSRKRTSGIGLSSQGFTLIELMIVVGIVAIIAAVGVPAYTNQINKAYRADAQSALMQLASAMERFRTVNNTYCNGGVCPHDGNGVPNATFFEAEAPLEGNDKYYDLLILNTGGGNSYRLKARPIDGGRMEGDWTFILEHTGRKRRSNGGADQDGWDI